MDVRHFSFFPKDADAGFLATANFESSETNAPRLPVMVAEQK